MLPVGLVLTRLRVVDLLQRLLLQLRWASGRRVHASAPLEHARVEQARVVLVEVIETREDEGVILPQSLPDELRPRTSIEEVDLAEVRHGRLVRLVWVLPGFSSTEAAPLVLLESVLVVGELIRPMVAVRHVGWCLLASWGAEGSFSFGPLFALV